MKVLFIIPLLIVAAISGYNLLYTADTLFLMVLHFTVFFACGFSAALLVRSMYTIRYIETEKVQPSEILLQEGATLQHS